MNRGERRIAEASGEDIVEAGHGDVFRHPYAGPGQGLEHPDGHLVVGGHDRVREVLAAHGDQPLARLLPAADAIEPLVGAYELAVGVQLEYVL